MQNFYVRCLLLNLEKVCGIMTVGAKGETFTL